MSQEFFRKAHDSLFIPPEGPGAAEPPSPELYALMGEGHIRALLRDFYQELEKSAIAGMFPKDMLRASEKSALFFIGLMGGPPLYMETYGPPRMRMRHMPFRITPAHRDVWLACFFRVLENPERYQFPAQHLEGFKAFLEAFSRWMQNSQGID